MLQYWYITIVLWCYSIEDPTTPVLKINDHATGGRRTKDILGGPKGWGPKKKVANVEIYVIFEVFAFCGGRTKTDFKDRALVSMQLVALMTWYSIKVSGRFMFTPAALLLWGCVDVFDWKRKYAACGLAKYLIQIAFLWNGRILEKNIQQQTCDNLG